MIFAGTCRVAVIGVLLGTAAVAGQNLAPIPFNGVDYVLYPETLDRCPQIPSPYRSDDGQELVIAFTSDGKFALIPVDLERDGGWRADLTDAEDFPALARTGLHSIDELRSISTVTGRTIEEINRLARPGGLSQDGFLAADEDLLSVLRGDNELANRLGLTHPDLARPLFHILRMIETDLALGRWDMAHHEWRNIVWLLYNGRRVYVDARDTKGGQLSPFDDGLEGGFYINIRREPSPEELQFLKERYSGLSPEAFERMTGTLCHLLTGELEPQYIVRYGFYEGHTDWRVDPLVIAFIFGLKRIEEIEAAFPRQIDSVLAAHFTSQQTEPKGTAEMKPDALFDGMEGEWEGNCRTWFRPGELADESAVRGRFEKVLGGGILRHTYQGTIQGKPRSGEELIAYNGLAESFEASWIDSFHMNYAIMFSRGKPTPLGFSVRGDYDVGPNQPKWGWRTEYELKDNDHLTITAYNITPDGTEAKAVETIYRRVR